MENTPRLPKTPRILLLALPESSSAVLYGFYEVFSTFSDAWCSIVENDPPTEAVRSAYYSTALAVCAGQSIESGMPVDIPALPEDP